MAKPHIPHLHIISGNCHRNNAYASNSNPQPNNNPVYTCTNNSVDASLISNCLRLQPLSSIKLQKKAYLGNDVQIKKTASKNQHKKEADPRNPATAK